MRKSLESEEETNQSLLYSFSSITNNSADSQTKSYDCSIENLLEATSQDLSFIFQTQREVSSAEDNYGISQSEFFTIILTGLDLSKDNFKNGLIQNLLTENGSKYMQKIIAKYGNSCSIFIYSIVRLYLIRIIR